MSEQADCQKTDGLNPEKTKTESSFKIFDEIEDIISGILEFIIRYARTLFRLTVTPLQVIELIDRDGVIKHSRPYTFLAIAAFLACLTLMTGVFLALTNSTNDILKIVKMQLNGI